VTERFTEATGTALVGGTEKHAAPTLRALLIPVLAVGAILALFPLWLKGSNVLMTVSILGLAFACYTIGFNLIFGSTGQLFLSVGALAGVGGYGAAILADTVGLPIILSVLLATMASSLTGGLLSWVAVRRSLGVIFTGIITLIFALSFQNLVLGLGDVTGGESGFLIESGRDSFLRSRIPAYYVMLALVLVFLMIHGLLRRSHVGWAFRALRDDEVAAELSGIDVARYKMIAGAMGSAMVALVGALYGHYEGFFSPTTFELGQVDVPVLVMLAFGGIGSLLGPVVGAAVFTVVDAVLRPLAQLRTAVYGVILLVLFLGFRNGVVPTVNVLVRRVLRRRAR